MSSYRLRLLLLLVLVDRRQGQQNFWCPAETSDFLTHLSFIICSTVHCKMSSIVLKDTHANKMDCEWLLVIIDFFFFSSGLISRVNGWIYLLEFNTVGPAPICSCPHIFFLCQWPQVDLFNVVVTGDLHWQTPRPPSGHRGPLVATEPQVDPVKTKQIVVDFLGPAPSQASSRSWSNLCDWCWTAANQHQGMMRQVTLLRRRRWLGSFSLWHSRLWKSRWSGEFSFY